MSRDAARTRVVPVLLGGGARPCSVPAAPNRLPKVSVHPQAIDLSAVDRNLNRQPALQVWSPKLEHLDAPAAPGSGRLRVSATLLVCLPAIIPTLWMGGMVLMALAVRY